MGCRSLASGPLGGQGGVTVLLCPKQLLVWGDLGGSPPPVPCLPLSMGTLSLPQADTVMYFTEEETQS